MILELGILCLSLALFTAFGLPAAAVLRRSMPAMMLSAPAFGAALLAIVVTLLFTAGLSASAIGLLVLVLALVAAAVFRATIRDALCRMARAPAAALVTLVYFAILISPILTGRLDFTAFQGNQWDHFTYLTSSAVYSKMSFHDVVNHTPAEALANPLLPVARTTAFARPAVDILFAVIGTLVPGGIAVGGYAFLCGFAIAGLLAFNGFLLQIFGRPGSASSLVAALLGGAYACGFWGQLPLDIDAWSQVAATPLLLAAWTLVFTILTAPGTRPALAPSAVLGLLIGGALFLYPEGSVYNGLILAGVLVAAGRPDISRLRPILGALVLGIGLSALAWRGTLGLLATQSQFAATTHVDWWQYFDSYMFGLDPKLNHSLQQSLSAALGHMPPDFIFYPDRVSSIVTGLAGIFGVYFLTPAAYDAPSLPDLAKAALLLCVVIGIALGCYAAARRRLPGYRLLLAAAAIALLGALLLLEHGEAWSAGKALGYAGPLLCLAIMAPAMAIGTDARWSRLGPLPWCLAQAGFVALTLIGLGNAQGIRLPAPYPDSHDPEMKAANRWEIAAPLARLRGCPLVEIVAPDPFFRQYAAIALYEAGKPYYYDGPVNAYYGGGKNLGNMATSPVARACRWVQPGVPRPVPPGPPAGVPSFPAGLMARDLFFAGVFQDGWLRDTALVKLALPDVSDRLHLTGTIHDFSPRIAAGSMKITVDGVPVLERPETPGDFDLTIPIPKAPGTRQIDLVMTGADHLPAPDGRLVSVQLSSIALESTEPAKPDPEDDPPE